MDVLAKELRSPRLLCASASLHESLVEGIEQISPRVAGLPERVLVLRDQRVPGLVDADEDAGPGKEISINFVPVMYPLYQPAMMIVKPGMREFWRV